jgi:hypothetical protein
MTRQEIINLMKGRYQVDPCTASRWLESSDIEEAVDIACVAGRAYLNDSMITWGQRTGYREQLAA